MLSIIFINYQSSVFLDRAISSVRQAEPDLSLEIVVVNNGSSDRTATENICRQHKVRLVLLPRNLGYGAAANRALKYINTPYVAVANPDIIIEPGAVSKLLQVLEKEPTVGAITPQLFYPDGRVQPSARRLPRFKYIFAGRRSLLSHIFPNWSIARDFQYLGTENAPGLVEVEALLGTFLVFRTTAIAQAGGFDERFFMFAEDMDISRRLRQSGWKLVLEPRSRVRHYCGGARQQLRRFTEYHRVRGLTLFFTLGRPTIARGFIRMLGAWYYITLEAMAVLGLYEHEYSWRANRC